MAADDHPIFSLIYRPLADLGERTGVGKARDEALRQTYGRLLILGLGLGHDLDHLPSNVSHVIAVEPSASMRRRSQGAVRRSTEAGVAVDLIAGHGEDLPLPNNSVDSALLSLVMCSVTEPEKVLTELVRVLRPGAPVGILEHVRAPEKTWTWRLQRSLNRVWPKIAGGCRVDRNTRDSLHRAGFDTSRLRDMRLAKAPVVAPTIVGTVYSPQSPGS